MIPVIIMNHITETVSTSFLTGKLRRQRQVRNIGDIEPFPGSKERKLLKPAPGSGMRNRLRPAPPVTHSQAQHDTRRAPAQDRVPVGVGQSPPASVKI
jgi:hypothetical protein